MAEKELTARALSRSSGVSRVTISNIVNRKIDPRIETLVALADAMGSELPELGGGQPVGDSLVTPPEHIAGGSRLLQRSGARHKAASKGITAKDAAGERVTAMISAAVGEVVRDVINRNELEGTRAGEEALVRAITAFAEAVQETGADVSELYRVALKLQRGEL